MNPNQPTVHVFKSGYQIAVETCGDLLLYLDPARGYGEGDHKRAACTADHTFELTRFTSSRSDYVRYLHLLFPLRVGECAYESFPRLYAEATKEYRRLMPESEAGLAYLAPENLALYQTPACHSSLSDAIAPFMQ